MLIFNGYIIADSLLSVAAKEFVKGGQYLIKL